MGVSRTGAGLIVALGSVWLGADSVADITFVPLPTLSVGSPHINGDGSTMIGSYGGGALGSVTHAYRWTMQDGRGIPRNTLAPKSLRERGQC